MTSNIDFLYMHSYIVDYSTDPTIEFHIFPLIFPETINVPANSLVNIDMKLRINLFCPYIPEFSCAAAIGSSNELINTPLVYALAGSLIYNNGHATNLNIPVRNISNTDYEIVAGTSLFNIYTQHGEKFVVKQVDEDHLSMVLE